jgi:hypothetical protein
LADHSQFGFQSLHFKVQFYATIDLLFLFCLSAQHRNLAQ